MATGTRIPTITWTFGKRLEAARKLAGFSQNQMAAELMRHMKLDTTRGYAALAPDRAAGIVALLDDAA